MAYQIGPGELNTGAGSPFILSKPEWVSVQCYVVSALHLPTDQKSMREELPADPPGGMDQFNDLLSAYKSLHDHCQYWQDHTLQDSVNCAADIVHYNVKVPSYYGALTKLLPKLELDPPDPAAVNQCKAILQNLSSQAKGYADHAQLVLDGMKTFSEQSAQDQLTIKPLIEKYKKKLGEQSPTIKDLSDELEKDKEALKAANEEYNHDVIVAATTPTYAWIWPAGTIAAGTVAGIYGKKATDALKRVHEYESKISLVSDQLQAAAKLLLDLQRIHSDLGDISDKLNTALPVLQKMHGAWTAIHNDLDNILVIIDQDIDQVPAILKSLGIDEAIQAWAQVAAEADAYRVNAYVTATTEDLAKEVGESMEKTA